VPRQPVQRGAQRLRQARRRLAGRRGQADQGRRQFVRRQRQQQGQQARDGSRFAGAGAAGDDGQARARGQRTGQLLPVRLT
jgi:hypothetical protein